MIYNFDEVIKRDNTNSAKWNSNFYKEVFNDKTELLPLWVADMDFRVSNGIKNRLQNLVEHGIFGYSGMGDDYYEAIHSWYKRKQNWEIEKESIVYTAGVVPAINYLIQTFTKEGDKILIQTPVYYPFKRSIKNHKRITIESPLIRKENNYYEMDFSDMEKKIKENNVKMFILCSPHNPVGRVWKKEELLKVASICEKYNVIVIADEIHSDLIFNNHKHTPFATIVSDKLLQNLIVCNAASKTFNLAGAQVSNIIIPNKEMRDLYKATLNLYSIASPNVFAIESIKGAYLESDDWYDEMIKYIENNMEFTENFLKEKLPKVIFRKPEGTYLGWINFNAYNFSDEEIVSIFENDIKVGVDYGHWFGIEGSGYVRMNFACPKSIISEALTRIYNFLKDK